MTGPEFVAPALSSPPYRALLLGSPMPGWYSSTDEERATQLIPRLSGLMDDWERMGLRLIASFDDDLFVAGLPAGLQFTIYLMVEVDTLDVLVGVIQSLRERVDGVRLDNYLRFEVRIGRALFFASDGASRNG